MEIKGYKPSRHFLANLSSKRHEIKLEWVERTLEFPDYQETVSREETRLWRRIPEFGNRYLRVVINPITKTIITVFFDRGFKNENPLR